MKTFILALLFASTAFAAYNPSNPNGQAVAASSAPVVLASDEISATTTGQSAQTATVNNILTTTSGTAATSVVGYKSGTIQVNSTGTSGAYILEGSVDNATFFTVPMYNQTVFTGTPITAAVTVTAVNTLYSFPVMVPFIRLRISTIVAGGSIQAYSWFSQTPWNPAVNLMSQATAANLNATVTATNLSTNEAQYGGSAVVTGGVAGVTAVGGNIAIGTAATANPAPVGGRIQTALPTTRANAQTAGMTFTTNDQLIEKPFGDASNDWQASSGITALATTTSTALKAAGAASIRNYVTGCQIYNTSATISTTVALLDGATVIWTGFLPATTAALALVPNQVQFITPLRGTAATAMNIQLGTTAAAVYYNCQGYQSF